MRAVRPHLGAALVAAAAALWGCWALFLRPSGLTGLQSSVVVLAVMAAPGPIVVRRAALADRGATWALVLLALADAGNMALYFAALQRGPIAVAVLTHYLAPVLVALVAPAVAGDSRSRRAELAAPVSLAGLALLVWRPAVGFPMATAALGAGSALFYAVIVLAAKRAGRAYSPIAVTALHAPVSALVLLALFGRAAIPDASGAAPVAVGGAISGVLASVLFYSGLARVRAAVAGALTYIEPLAAAAVAWIAFGEALDPPAIAGAFVVLACGVWVALEPAAAVAPARSS